MFELRVRLRAQAVERQSQAAQDPPRQGSRARQGTPGCFPAHYYRRSCIKGQRNGARARQTYRQEGVNTAVDLPCQFLMGNLSARAQIRRIRAPRGPRGCLQRQAAGPRARRRGGPGIMVEMAIVFFFTFLLHNSSYERSVFQCGLIPAGYATVVTHLYCRADAVSSASESADDSPDGLTDVSLWRHKAGTGQPAQPLCTRALQPGGGAKAPRLACVASPGRRC